MIETQCRGKVLVADGDVLSRRFLQQVLSRSGYRVVSMVTEAEAKEEVKPPWIGGSLLSSDRFTNAENRYPRSVGVDCGPRPLCLGNRVERLLRSDFV